MSLSERELEEKIEELLPKILKELSMLYSAEQLATKDDLKLLINTMDKRFENIDKRFEKQNQKFDHLLGEVRSISVGLGTLGNRTGNEFEQLIRSLFTDILMEENIDVKYVKKIGIRNNKLDILNGLEKITFDGYFHNGREILMEIKFSMDENKINWFFTRAKAYEKIKGNLPELWVLAVNIDEITLSVAKELGMKVISRFGTL